MPTHLSDVPSPLIPSIVERAHAMGTMPHNTHCSISRSGNTMAETGFLPHTWRENLSPQPQLLNHSWGSLLCHQGRQVFSHWLKLYSTGQRFDFLKKQTNLKKITESREETTGRKRKLYQKQDKITQYWRKSHEEVKTDSSPLCSMPVLMISKGPRKFSHVQGHYPGQDACTVKGKLSHLHTSVNP